MAETPHRDPRFACILVYDLCKQMLDNAGKVYVLQQTSLNVWVPKCKVEMLGKVALLRIDMHQPTRTDDNR
jgi:hypothetical protein